MWSSLWSKYESLYEKPKAMYVTDRGGSVLNGINVLSWRLQRKEVPLEKRRRLGDDDYSYNLITTEPLHRLFGDVGLLQWPSSTGWNPRSAWLCYQLQKRRVWIRQNTGTMQTPTTISIIIHVVSIMVLKIWWCQTLIIIDGQSR